MYPKQCFWVHIVETCTRKWDFGYILSNGGPSLTWTVDKTIMSRLLWPTELKGRNGATCRTWTHNQLFTKQLHSHCAKVANRWTWKDSNPRWMHGFSIRFNTTANAVCLKPLSHMSIIGRSIRIRTWKLWDQNPLPYHLAMLLKIGANEEIRTLTGYAGRF